MPGVLFTYHLNASSFWNALFALGDSPIFRPEAVLSHYCCISVHMLSDIIHRVQCLFMNILTLPGCILMYLA